MPAGGDDVAVDVGEPEVAALIAVGEPGMVYARARRRWPGGRDMDGIFCDVVAVFVGLA